MKCPNCGADNDPSNRFCEQCGAPLAASAAASVPSAGAASSAVAAGTCPNCGSPVLPGQAFCDECGVALPATSAAPTSADAPTVAAAPTSAAGAASGADGVVCAVCGHHNMPGDRYCDNCGAELGGVTAPTPATSSAASFTSEEPTMVETAPATQTSTPDTSVPSATIPDLPGGLDDPNTPVGPMDNPPAVPPEPAEEPPIAPPPPVEEPPAIDVPIGDPTSNPPMDAPPAQEPEPIQMQAPSTGDATTYEADRTRLEGIISAQGTIIAQLEPVQTALGAATPSGVAQSLDAARAALAQAQGDLAALHGGSAPTTSPAPDATAPAATASAASQASPPVESVPLAPPPTPQPRLVVEDGGRELPFPANKQEIIIGREDPISGVFPEIDLTSYGGEGGGVSRQHARLNSSGGQWTITDLNSTNYTRVDGTKIEPNTPTPIADGSRIQLGRVALVFHES